MAYSDSDVLAVTSKNGLSTRLRMVKRRVDVMATFKAGALAKLMILFDNSVDDNARRRVPTLLSSGNRLALDNPFYAVFDVLALFSRI